MELTWPANARGQDVGRRKQKTQGDGLERDVGDYGFDKVYDNEKIT